MRAGILPQVNGSLCFIVCLVAFILQNVGKTLICF